MTKSILDLRDEFRDRYGVKPVKGSHQPIVDEPPAIEVEPERAFVVEGKGRTVITAPLREVAAKNVGFTYLRGRFVEADTPNGNGALWTTEDLQIGEATVAGGPLNWLHQEDKIIGTLLDGQLVSGREAAGAGVGNHIVSTAAVWRFLFQREADTIEKAAKDGALFYSMECLSREVACVDTPGRPGCGEQFSYADYDAKRACAHLNQRASVRRFVDPLFLGGAIIVPPIQPGWGKAEVEVMRQAAALSEREHLENGLGQQEAETLAAQIITWANR